MEDLGNGSSLNFKQRRVVRNSFDMRRSWRIFLMSQSEKSEGRCFNSNLLAEGEDSVLVQMVCAKRLEPRAPALAKASLLSLVCCLTFENRPLRRVPCALFY